MAFIGTPLDTRNTFQSLVGKRFNGDGSETDFTLDVAPSSTLDIEVFVGNVRQDPNSAYTLSGTTLTFTGAPPSGTNNIYVVHQAKSVGTIGIPDDTISARTLVTLDNSADHVLIEDATDGELKKALIPAASFAGIDDQSSSNDDQITIADGSVVINEDSDDVDFRVESNGNANMLVVNGGGDRVGVGADPDLGVGLHIKTADAGGGSIDGNGDELVIENDDHTGITLLVPNDKKGNVYFADPDANAPGVLRYDHANNSMQFITNASEKMRITTDGRVGINKTPNGTFFHLTGTSNTDYLMKYTANNNTAQTHYMAAFTNLSDSTIGSITSNNNNAVAFNTSSDYRLKENVDYTWDATTRLKQLKPARFNFISDETNTLVDGFIAHEVTPVVPESINGTKDATKTYTDENGDEQTKIIPQGIDQSKLVPLLTKALQEAITEIESLKARVTTLEE